MLLIYFVEPDGVEFAVFLLLGAGILRCLLPRVRVDDEIPAISPLVLVTCDVLFHCGMGLKSFKIHPIAVKCVLLGEFGDKQIFHDCDMLVENRADGLRHPKIATLRGVGVETDRAINADGLLALLNDVVVVDVGFHFFVVYFQEQR